MTSEEIAALFDKHDDEYLEFDRFPVSERLDGNDDLCGILKLPRDSASTSSSPPLASIAGAARIDERKYAGANVQGQLIPRLDDAGQVRGIV